MQIAKEMKSGCRAKRCGAEAVATAQDLGDYGTVRLCGRHASEVGEGDSSALVYDPPASLGPGVPGAYPHAAPTRNEAAEAARTTAEEMLTAIEGFEVRDQGDLEIVAEVVSEAKARWAALEEERKKITGPIDSAKRAVQALFKPALDALAEVERAAKSVIAAHSARETDRNRRLAEAAAEGDRSAVASITTTREVQGISTRQVKAYEVTDADAVPRELCSPDPARIRGFMSTLSEAEMNSIDLPGVRLYYETQVVSK